MESVYGPKRNLGAGLDLTDDLALNEDQQQKLQQLKLETKLRNEKYFRAHPELQCLVTSFLEEAFVKQPENLRKFSVEFFTRPDLRREVDLLLAKQYPPPTKLHKSGSASSEEIDLCEPIEPYPWDQEGSITDLVCF